MRIGEIQGRVPRVERPRVVVFAGDHGVAREESVTPYPAEVTGLMVRCFAAGRAAVSVLARQAGADLEVVDTGVAGLGPVEGAPGVRVIAASTGAHPSGTRNLAREPAMDAAGLSAAWSVGAEAARRASRDGVDLLALGEMGIGNSTAAAAVAARLLGRPARDLAGPGTGLSSEGVAHKASVIERGLARGGPADAQGALADLGGFELAALAGCMCEAAALGIPVILDGFIVGAAALAAVRHQAEVARALLPATRSAEPGHALILEALGIGPPILDLGMRLGEASGAALAIPICRSACALMSEMASLENVLAGSFEP